MRQLWEGYLQFGLTDSHSLVYFIIDVVLASAVIFVMLRCFNTRHGWFGLAGVMASLILLAISSFWRLPGLHLVAQGLVVILLVALPVLCKDDWLALFIDRGKTNGMPSPTPTLPLKSLVPIALVFALVLVSLATGIRTKTGELPQEILVSAANLPTGVSANFGSQTKVRVIVTAPRDQWKNLRADVFSATVDVGNQGEGSYDLPIRLSSTLPNLKIVRSKPERLVVAVEPIIRKTVPVVVKFTGRPGDDLVTDEPVIDPDKVEVAGPKSIVGDITQAVVTVKLDGETKAVTQKTTVQAERVGGEKIESVTFSPAEISVRVPLVKAGKLKSLGVGPVVTGVPASGWWVKSVTVTPSIVTVTGTVEALDKTKTLSTETLSLNNTGTDLEQQISLVFPPGITVADGTQKVTVKIILERSHTTKTITPEILYTNLAGSLKVTAISPTAISAVISGPTDQLANLATDAVKVSLDLSAYRSAGRYSITVSNSDFSLSSGLSLVSLLPSALDVTLENK